MIILRPENIEKRMQYRTIPMDFMTIDTT